MEKGPRAKPGGEKLLKEIRTVGGGKEIMGLFSLVDCGKAK